MINIDDIKEKVRQNKYEISMHTEKERYAEDINIPDIESAIDTGEVLDIIQMIREEKVV